MVANKCQPSSKDQAHHIDTDTTTIYHTTFQNVVWCHHEESSVVWLWYAWSVAEGRHLWATVLKSCVLHYRLQILYRPTRATSICLVPPL